MTKSVSEIFRKPDCVKLKRMNVPLIHLTAFLYLELKNLLNRYPLGKRDVEIIHVFDEPFLVENEKFGIFFPCESSTYIDTFLSDVRAEGFFTIFLGSFFDCCHCSYSFFSSFIKIKKLPSSKDIGSKNSISFSFR